MSKLKELQENLRACFLDWGNNFDVDIEYDHHYQNHDYYSVVISYEDVDKSYEITARVCDSMECEFDVNEDNWQPVNKANLFAYMWFEDLSEQ